MKILLVNLDSTIPNLALEKIRMYHEQQGNRVRQIKDQKGNDKKSLPNPLVLSGYDKIYVSCIFKWNAEQCKKWEDIAEIGGSGYSLDKVLPKEIDSLKPKINMGFVTRGCIRNCPWCIVPKKEGHIKEVADLYDIWDGNPTRKRKRKIRGVKVEKEVPTVITLMDNNILALPKTFFKVSNQIKKEGLEVDFNQGLDHRLLTNEIVKQLLSLKYPDSAGNKIRFAFDHISYKNSVVKALKLLKKHGLRDWQTRWYVYVGDYDTTETVLERLNIIRKWKQAAFLMRDRCDKVQNNKEFAKMYSWTSSVAAFYSVTYEEYKQSHKKKRKDSYL